MGSNGYFMVKDSYIDRHGNSLYKMRIEFPWKYKGLYELWRIDPSGSTLEVAWDYADYPDNIDPLAYKYYTFYR